MFEEATAPQRSQGTPASSVALAPEYDGHRPQRLRDLSGRAKFQLHNMDITSVHNHVTSTTSLKPFRSSRRVVAIEPVDTLCGCGRFGFGFRMILVVLQGAEASRELLLRNLCDCGLVQGRAIAHAWYLPAFGGQPCARKRLSD